MRNNNMNSKFGKKKGTGGTPFSTNSKTPGKNETLAKDHKGPKVDGVKKPTEHKESFQTSKKNLVSDINTFNMSKSLFDKLFEDVMSGGMDEAGTPALGGSEEYSDEQELGIETGGDEMGGDEVTITLDKATAQKFCDALQAVLGSGDDFGGEDEDEGEEDLDLGGEDFGDEDEDEGTFGEATDIEELKAKPETLQNKNNKVEVSAQFKPKGGKAQHAKIPAQDTGSPFSAKASTLQQKGHHKVSSFNYSDSAFNGGSK